MKTMDFLTLYREYQKTAKVLDQKLNFAGMELLTRLRMNENLEVLDVFDSQNIKVIVKNSVPLLVAIRTEDDGLRVIIVNEQEDTAKGFLVKETRSDIEKFVKEFSKQS